SSPRRWRASAPSRTSAAHFGSCQGGDAPPLRPPRFASRAAGVPFAAPPPEMGSKGPATLPNALLFPTIDFAVFFAVVFLLSWLLNPFPRRWKLFMLAASYFFYGYWDARFVLLLSGATVVNHAAAVAIARSRRAATRRVVLFGAVAADLAALGWFKYYGF